MSFSSPRNEITKPDDLPTEEFRRWMEEVTNQQPLIGSGSPEGVFEANPGRLYVDQAAASGSVLYVKKLAEIAGDRKKGWSL